MSNKNKNGIPVADPPRGTLNCYDRKSGKKKRLFHSQFLAERFIAESIPPAKRDSYRVYACGDHFHMTTQKG